MTGGAEERALARIPWWGRLPLLRRLYMRGWQDGVTMVRELIRESATWTDA